MTLQEIKDAVNNGKTVCWVHEGYRVRKGIEIIYHRENDIVSKSEKEWWNVVCIGNSHTIGLTHRDEITMNGTEEQFFIKD